MFAAELAKRSYSDLPTLNLSDLKLSVEGIIREKSTSTEGFIASDEKHLYIVIRGTDDLEDWFTNLSIKLVDWQIGDDRVKVEEGFYGSYASIFTDVYSVANAFVSKQLVVIGHSLGSSVVSMIARAMSYRNPIVWSFEGPRCGDSAWANSFNESIKTVYRITNKSDIVPTVPIVGYKHYKGGIWLDGCGGYSEYNSDLKTTIGGWLHDIWRWISDRWRKLQWKDFSKVIDDHGMDSVIRSIEKLTIA